MKLIKFCNNEHNILRGSAIKIGTLYGYRAIENSELKDEHEGKYSFTVRIGREPVTLDLNWAHLLLAPHFQFLSPDQCPQFVGPYSSNIVHMNLVEKTDSHLIIKDTVIELYRSVPNCFVFCMSQLPDASSRPFNTHNDHWSIQAADAEKFARVLACHFHQQVTTSSFCGAEPPNQCLADLEALQLCVRHQLVRYENREILITQGSVPPFEWLVGILRDMAFIKPLDFINEHEYRFIFELECESKLTTEIFPANVENVFLKLNSTSLNKLVNGSPNTN